MNIQMKIILTILGLVVFNLINFSQETGTYTDARDGKVYKWVRIGNQVWMAENLAYLPAVSKSSPRSYNEPCYYVYGYKDTSINTAKTTANYGTYGVLYNWSAAIQSCPSGWHLPSDAEWTELTDYLGGGAIAGSKLKETGNEHWKSLYKNANNYSGFTALPGGCRDFGGSVKYKGKWGYWWSNTEVGASYAWIRSICNYAAIYRDYVNELSGLSVRCVKDN
jgi:uncharacterized protein (TIGR02145 family)